MDNSEMIFSIVIWLVIIVSLIYLLIRKIIKEENEDFMVAHISTQPEEKGKGV